MKTEDLDNKTIRDRFRTWYNEQDTDLTIEDIQNWWLECLNKKIVYEKANIKQEIQNFIDGYEPNLSYQDPLFRDAQTAGENALNELVIYLQLKNKVV